MSTFQKYLDQELKAGFILPLIEDEVVLEYLQENINNSDKIKKFLTGRYIFAYSEKNALLTSENRFLLADYLYESMYEVVASLNKEREASNV